MRKGEGVGDITLADECNVLSGWEDCLRSSKCPGPVRKELKLYNFLIVETAGLGQQTPIDKYCEDLKFCQSGQLYTVKIVNGFTQHLALYRPTTSHCILKTEKLCNGYTLSQ